eukprot:2101505-Karenia_brevis.AAC.1
MATSEKPVPEKFRSTRNTFCVFFGSKIMFPESSVLQIFSLQNSVCIACQRAILMHKAVSGIKSEST